MDVVLLKDVERLGTEGTVVRVSPGYARNFLLPRGLAAPATAQQLNTLEGLKRQRSQKVQRALEEANALKQKLERCSLTLTLNLGADEKPFGAVTTHDILDAVQHEGIALDKHAIGLKQPIKALGVYDIPVRVHPEVMATLKVWVVKQ